MPPTGQLRHADGFESVDVAPRPRPAVPLHAEVAPRGPIEVLQTAKGRRISKQKRVARFTGRSGAFTWNGRKTSGKKARVARGVYFVRFRVHDAKKVDTRRVVGKRSNGRFYKQGKFVHETRCP